MQFMVRNDIYNHKYWHEKSGHLDNQDTYDWSQSGVPDTQLQLQLAIEQLLVTPCAFRWWYFRVAKPWNVCMATKGNLPHFCQPALPLLWLLNIYNTNYQVSFYLWLWKRFVTTVSIFLYHHRTCHYFHTFCHPEVHEF